MTITWTYDRDQSLRYAASIREKSLPVAQPQLLAELEASSDDAFAHELRLRSGPLREQWDARGPGLMRNLGELAPKEATVALVAPLVGGHGDVDSESGLVRFEAVLTNPVAEVPEVVRLAWLLAQLGEADAEKLAQPVIEAAAEVELVAMNDHTIAIAREAWRL